MDAGDANGKDANGKDANGKDANGKDANGKDANGKAHGMGVLALRSPSTYYIPAVVAAVCVAFMAGAKR